MLYTITHGKHRTSAGESYQQYLDIVNKEALLSVAETLGITGVAKSHAKEKMTKVISTYVLEHLEEILSRLSVKELRMLKDCVVAGANIRVERPSRRLNDTLTTLLQVSVYHSKKERRFYFLLPDELRELFAPLLDKACFFIAGIDETSLLQSVDTTVTMNQNGDYGIPVPDYIEENVSTEVVKIIQSYVGIVNKMVWRKF